MKYKSQIVTQASGSVGGTTYSHNASGLYQRARSIPVNPNSPQQAAVRGFQSQLSNHWVNTLSVAQRAAWDTYAQNVLIPNTLGDPVNIGGIAQYIRSNVPRLQAALARVDTAPTIFDLGEFTNPTISAVDAAADEVDVGFTNTDDWAGEVGSAMLVLASRPQNSSVNFFKGPYRFAGLIAGAVVPPTSPATLALPFPVVAGQRVFFQFRVSRVDGRLSGTFRNFGTAA